MTPQTMNRTINGEREKGGKELIRLTEEEMETDWIHGIMEGFYVRVERDTTLSVEVGLLGLCRFRSSPLEGFGVERAG